MIDRNRRRQFGQNYLKDPAILFEMGEAINASRNENIFEIGPTNFKDIFISGCIYSFTHFK